MGDVVLKLESAIGGDESAPIHGEGYGVMPPREEEELGDTPSPRSNETASQSGESSVVPHDEYDEDDDLETDGAIDGGNASDDPIFDMPSLMPNFAGGLDAAMVPLVPHLPSSLFSLPLYSPSGPLSPHPCPHTHVPRPCGHYAV